MGKKKKNVSKDTHTHKSSISFLHCSCQMFFYFIFVCSDTIWNALVMLKTVPSVVWPECVSCPMFLSVVSSMYFSLLWKWRVLANVVDGLRGGGHFTPPLVHGLALLGQSCVPKMFCSWYIFLQNKSLLKMISQGGSSTGGSARSLSLLIGLEIRHTFFFSFFFLADSSDASEARTWSDK